MNRKFPGAVVGLVLIGAVSVSTLGEHETTHAEPITTGAISVSYAFSSAVDEVRHRLYVTTYSPSGVLSVFDTETGAPLGSRSITSSPASVEVNDVTGYVYVMHQGVGDRVSVYSNDLTLLTELPALTNPWGPAINSLTNRVYVANTFGGDVWVVDGATHTLITTIGLAGTSTLGIAVDESRNLVYALDRFSNELYVIDGATNAVLNTVVTGATPVSVAVDEPLGKVFVLNQGDNSFTVYDAGTMEVIGGAPVGSGAQEIVVNDVTHRAYVTVQGTSSVAVIDTVTNVVVDSVPVSGGQSYQLSADESGSKVFVPMTTGNQVIVLSDAIPPVAQVLGPTGLVTFQATTAGQQFETVNFDGGLADGQLITDQYQAQGVTFAGIEARNLTGTHSQPTGAQQVGYNTGAFTGDVTIDFVEPVASFGLYLNDNEADTRVRVTVDGGDVAALGIPRPAGAGGALSTFYGFTAPTNAITRIFIDSPGDLFILDDLTLGRLPATPPPGSFVSRAGTELMFEDQPFRFTGINIYDANNTIGCGDPQRNAQLGTALNATGPAQVMRAWFFQSLAIGSNGQFDYTAFDRTLAEAKAKGVKVIATLGNQWPDCDGPSGGAGLYKNADWYQQGYRTTPDPGMTADYLDWVIATTGRYKNDPTIMAWELVNEPEVRIVRDGQCAQGAGQILATFADDVASTIKATDPNHLVSLGVIGGGQCGAEGGDYELVHASSAIDLCSYHDYGAAAAAVPGDQWNGLALRLQQCRDLDKPLIIGESGLTLAESGGTAAARAEAFRRKMTTEFRAGISGYLLWGWLAPPHAISPGDPALTLLDASTVWPDDGGDDDNDGISNRIDPGTGFNDEAGTTGTIPTGQGRQVVVLDAPAPNGVTIHVASSSPGDTLQLTLCGANVTVATGTEATMTCGSLTTAVSTGSVQVHISSTASVTIPAGATAKVDWTTDGAFTVSNITGSGVTANVSGTQTPIAAGSLPRTFRAWQFIGFAAPINNTGLNTVKAGTAVTLTWTLRDPAGRPVTTLQQATIRVAAFTPCPGRQRTADGPATSFIRDKGLKYLGNGTYSIKWTTPKTYKGSCKQMRLDLGEGTTHTATFNFT